MAYPVRPDPAAICRALAVLHEPGSPVELRAPDAGRLKTVSGYFDDWDHLARAAADLDGRAAGVYVTLNPIPPALLARAHNRAIPYAKHTTADADVIARRWLPVDCDPVRPAGIPSSDAEHAAALARARQIAAWLEGRGWPAPLLADSGNGGHLLCRVDLPADDGGLVGRALAALALRFSDEAVAVDTTVANPARIWKLYGSVARKGDATPDRPHRLARLLAVPPQLVPVPRDVLDALAASIPTPDPSPAGEGGAGGFDLAAWLARSGLAARGPLPWQSGRKWVLPVCPWNPAHTDGAAYIVQFPSGAIAAGCHHAGCQGKGWHDLRDAVDPGWRGGRATGGPTAGATFDAASTPRPAPWPTLRPDALTGLAGAVVRALAPHTEADPAALLLGFLLSFGNAAGRGPHALADGARHGLNEFAVIVGETAKARKDTARHRIRPIFAALDPDWAGGRQGSGLSSGEGFIYAVRDPIFKREKNAKTGVYEEVCVDPGEVDKRLMVDESEYATVLKVIQREGNTLSDQLRKAWDGRSLRSMTRNSPLMATDPHISAIANITREEFQRLLTETEAANGLLNRFLIACAQRARLLPDGGRPVDLAPLLPELAATLAFARDDGRFARDAAATALWHRVYHHLAAPAGGLYGALTARGEAHLLRLSCLYAALDRSAIVREGHLRAAVAVWRYCEESVRYLFGDAVGDAVADRLYATLVERPDGLSRTDLQRYGGGNHLPAARFDAALGTLLRARRAVRSARAGTGVKRVEWWQALPPDRHRDGWDAVLDGDADGEVCEGCEVRPADAGETSQTSQTSRPDPTDDWEDVA